MNGAFVYDPLPEGHIRLLSVKGVNADGRVEYALESKEMTGSLRFYALSYVWASGTRSRVILCNDREMAVTQSVYDVLAASQGFPRDDWMPLWIDAICINQHDNAEKGKAVGQMNVIYQRATSVIVWLGNEANDSKMAMDQIENLAQATSLIPDPASTRIWDGDIPFLGLPPGTDPVWPALGHLYRRAWFGRLWVFQEAVLATAARVVCGDRAADFEALCQLGKWINEAQMHSLVWSGGAIHREVNGLAAVNEIILARYFMKVVRYIFFSSLLHLSQNRRCTEPRDRAYGMLSLTSEEFRSKVNISYERDLNSLWIEIGKACLEQDQALAYLQIEGGRGKTPGLPSWCTNLESSPTDAVPYGDHGWAGVRYDEPEAVARIQTFSDRHTLELVGFRADRVDHVVPPCDMFPDGCPPVDDAALHDWLEQCLQAAHSNLKSDPGKNQPPLAHIYAVTGSITQQTPDSAALRQAYEAFHQVLATRGRRTGEPPSSYPAEYLPIYARILGMMVSSCRGRPYLTTTGNRLGIGPRGAMPGDIVVVAYGVRPVYLLREIPGSSALQFVGTAFVDGLMELSKTPAELIREETFCIE